MRDSEILGEQDDLQANLRSKPPKSTPCVELFDCFKEGMRYVAGFLAKSFLKTWPELGKKSSEFFFLEKVPSEWISLVSLGGLVQPSSLMMRMMTEFESIFQDFHKQQCHLGDNVMVSLMDCILMKFPGIPFPMVRKYVRTRTFIRIKYLNNQIKDDAARKKREKKKLIEFTT